MRIKVMYETIYPDCEIDGEPHECGIDHTENRNVSDRYGWTQMIQKVAGYGPFDSASVRGKEVLLYCADSQTNCITGIDTRYSLAISGTTKQIDRLVNELRAKKAL